MSDPQVKHFDEYQLRGIDTASINRILKGTGYRLEVGADIPNQGFPPDPPAGLDPADPIKSKNPEVLDHDSAVADSLGVAFVDRYDPTVISGVQHFNRLGEPIPVLSAPFYEHNEGVIRRQRAYISNLCRQNEQLRFLLAQAPIRLAPVDLREAAHSVTKYAYISRKTFRTFTHCVFSPTQWNEPWYSIASSPTKWVMTDLMPDGTVIYTPNAMPEMSNIALNLQDLMRGEKS